MRHWLRTDHTKYVITKLETCSALSVTAEPGRRGPDRGASADPGAQHVLFVHAGAFPHTHALIIGLPPNTMCVSVTQLSPRRREVFCACRLALAQCLSTNQWTELRDRDAHEKQPVEPLPQGLIEFVCMFFVVVALWLQLTMLQTTSVHGEGLRA